MFFLIDTKSLSVILVAMPMSIQDVPSCYTKYKPKFDIPCVVGVVSTGLTLGIFASYDEALAAIHDSITEFGDPWSRFYIEGHMKSWNIGRAEYRREFCNRGLNRVVVCADTMEAMGKRSMSCRVIKPVDRFAP